MENRFYVYVLLDPSKPGDYKYGDIEFEFEPFYIGKGTAERIYTTQIPSRSCKFKRNKLLSIKSKGLDVVFRKVYEGLTDEKSREIEMELIKIIGRRDLKLGPLVNLTDGGDGRKNGKNGPESNEKIRQSLLKINELKRRQGHDFSLSEEAKEKLRQINLGENNPMFGKTHSEEFRETHSKRVSGTNHPMFGKKHDEATLLKIKENRNASVDQEKLNRISIENNQKSVLQFSLSGDFIAEFGSIKEASIATGCSESIIGKCCRGQIKNPRTFIFKFKNPKDKELKNSFKIKIGDKFGDLILVKRNKKSVVVKKGGELITIRMKDNPIFWEKRSI